ncbi:DinB family protein [Polaribacter sp.]|uniref:DinB family protein n=1 Tax=Polaribacter sp. TaxID=1920175 RepID=UPI003F6BAC8B
MKHYFFFLMDIIVIKITKLACANIRKSIDMVLKNEYSPYFEQYISLVSDKDKSIIDFLYDSQHDFEKTLRNLPKEKVDFAYAVGKWTIKELIQHIIDTERIFCYRALSIARNDKTNLPGFDQDIFVENCNVKGRDYDDILNEMQTLRKSTIQLFKSFSNEALVRVGLASGNKISVRALGYLFSGHQMHHLNILKERYL